MKIKKLLIAPLGFILFHSSFCGRAWAVSNAPAITNQPQSQFVEVGKALSLNLVASGSPPMSYQWQQNGANLVDGGNVSGSATSNLVLSTTAPTNGGCYTVIVSNTYGSLTSSVAKVTIVGDLMTFDEWPDTTYGWMITNGYLGLSWSNFFVLDGLEYADGLSGYAAGVVSPDNIAFNGNGLPASISSAVPFDFNSAYVTAAFNDNLQLQAEGFTGGALTCSNVYTLSSTNPTLINFNYHNVDRIYFNPYGGTPNTNYGPYGNSQFALDNVSFSTSTFPPQLQTTNMGPGTVQFNWNAVNSSPAVGYQVQYCTNLTPGGWLNLGGPQTNTSFTYTVGPDPRRFYRLLLVQ